MPAIDDGRQVKLYDGSGQAVTDSVLIGNTGTATDGHLASFVTDITGQPVVKAYIDGNGSYIGGNMTLTGANGLVINNATSQIINAAGNGPMLIECAALNSLVTSTVAAITLQATTAVSTGDLILDVQRSGGTSVLKVTQEGNVTTPGSVTVGTTLATTGAAAITGALTLPTAVGTAATGSGITANTSAEVRHVVNKITADYTAFSAAALTKDLTLWTLPAKTRVLRVIADVTTKFIGGTIDSATLRCGKAANGADYLVDGNVFAAAIVLGDVSAERGASLVDATVADATWASTQIVNVRLTSTTANLSALTQGSVTLYIECCVYP